MEIKDMTMEDIEAREASIREEVKTEGADLEALETETRALQERKAELKAEIETRKASMEAVASGSGEEVEKTEERTIMTDMEIRNSAAYIDAYVNYIKTNDFKVFGWYRIGLGTVMMMYFLIFG